MHFDGCTYPDCGPGSLLGRRDPIEPEQLHGGEGQLQSQPCTWVQPQPSPKQRPPFHFTCVASNYGNTDAAQITLAELR